VVEAAAAAAVVAVDARVCAWDLAQFVSTAATYLWRAVAPLAFEVASGIYAVLPQASFCIASGMPRCAEFGSQGLVRPIEGGGSLVGVGHVMGAM